MTTGDVTAPHDAQTALDDQVRYCAIDAAPLSVEQGDTRLTEVSRAIALALRP